MEKMRLRNSILLTFMCPMILVAQINAISADTMRINSLLENSRSWHFKQNIDSALFYVNSAYHESIKADFYKGKVSALLLKGHISRSLHILRDTAHQAAFQLLKIARFHHDTLLMIRAHRMKGQIYYSAQIWTKSYEYYLKALKLAEAISNEKETASACRQIGVAYCSIGGVKKNEMGLQYYLRASEIYKSLNDTNAIAGMYFVMGIAYSNLGDHEKGKYCQHQLIKYCELLGDEICIAQAQNELASYYSNVGEPAKSLELALDSYKRLKNTMASKASIANTCAKINQYLQALGRYDEIIPYLNELLSIALDINDRSHELSSYTVFAAYYEHRKDYKQAVFYHKKAYELNWELNDALLSKQMDDMEAKYDTEKKQTKIEALETEQKLQTELADANQNKQQIIIIAIGTGFGLMLIFSIIIFNRFRITSRQKKIVAYQKKLVEHKNKEILDSITYAERIQAAILPPMALMNEKLKDGFVLYIPKDIVAGDFYWLEALANDIYFSAADCTGHGVPGAMMSVMCSNALTKCVKEIGLTDPGEILDATTKIIEGRFERSEQLVLDGMDLALCKLNLKTRNLEYAGANNPLWIIRGHEVIETKADKQPIGQYDHRKPYTNHLIKLEKGDSIYIFSDGFVDQFGGPKWKKFKSKAFKKLLLKLQNESMDKQKELINEAFESWKGVNEQVDDICVIGVKI